MLNGQKFPFTDRVNNLGQPIVMPYLPITLANNGNSIEVMALLDTGASVNVLPYEIGRQLGAIWEEQNISMQLSGNLANSEARGLVVSGTVSQFLPILLAFAWSRSTDAPIILGHLNFFAEFNVCFFRHELTFDVSPRKK